MDDLRDVELEKTADEPAPPPIVEGPGGPGFWPIAVVLGIAVGIAAYFVFSDRRPAPPAPPKAVSGTTEAIRPLGGEPDAITLPPLDETDALVRRLVAALSSHPRVAAWLATDGLIRHFTAAVENIAAGGTPAPHLRALRPSSGFTVIERGGAVLIDPASHDRYTDVAAAVASVDARGSARVYATLKPRIDEAYRELGAPDGSVDRALERALATLLATPIVEGAIRVEPRGIGYGFADPDLEDLAPAQKQLLRMGPRNARIVQDTLREIAGALGIPAERLRGIPPR
jgi:hypothetical protein